MASILNILEFLNAWFAASYDHIIIILGPAPLYATFLVPLLNSPF